MNHGVTDAATVDGFADLVKAALAAPGTALAGSTAPARGTAAG